MLLTISAECDLEFPPDSGRVKRCNGHEIFADLAQRLRTLSYLTVKTGENSDQLRHGPSFPRIASPPTFAVGERSCIGYLLSTGTPFVQLSSENRRQQGSKRSNDGA